MSNVKNYTEQGGEKTVIGGTIEIENGAQLILGGTPISPAAYQADSVASTIAALVIDFNGLLAKLRSAGLMESE